MGVDPLAKQYGGFSPYNYTLNNPLRFTDPTGMAVEDKIKVDTKTGMITSVIKEKGSNRFFDDKSGEELFFHDTKKTSDSKSGADEDMRDGIFRVNEKLFYPVSIKNYVAAIHEAGVDEKKDPSLVSTAISSYSKADFAEDYLKNNHTLMHGYESPTRRTNYPENSGYFKFEGSNIVYNLYDAGNHMWGTWMRLNGYSEKGSLKAAQYNEFGKDTKADQSAIKKGWRYGTYNPYK